MPARLTLVPASRAGLTVHGLAEAGDLGVDAFVTDRFGGVSLGPYASLNLGDHVGDRPEAVAENRHRVARAAGVDDLHLVTMRQVHGAASLVVDRPGPPPECDAILTDTGDLALMVLVADCVPVLYVDTTTDRLAVAHAGWRGLAAGVLEATLARFADPSTVAAFVGPSISVDAYQVGPEVADPFRDVPGACRPDVGDRLRVDLRAVAVHRLRQAGVDDARLAVSREVTDGGEIFFSDRAARPCGRFALVARRSS